MLTTTSRNAVTTLGQYLASIRADRRLTLRQVEEQSQKQVSNAYLSQIENGKIKNPSVNVLHTLSEIYHVDYDKLMEMAGYVTPNRARSDQERHGRAATFADMNLSDDEEHELIQYLQFLRSRKRKD